MTGDATSLRIPPEIRRRLDGIEAELRPTPARSPVRAASADGRPALYLVDGRVASRVRPTPVRRARRMNPGWLAVATVASLVATVGLAGLFATGGGSGPGASAASAVSSVPPAPSVAATAAASVAAPSTSAPAPVDLPPGVLPPLVDLQVIRVAADPANAATRRLRSRCVTKEPGLDQVVLKRLLTTALVAKVDGGWVDQTRTMFVAHDVIDAAQAFGATVLIEGPDETWVVARDGRALVALHLESMPTVKDRQAWWSALVLRPTACT